MHKEYTLNEKKVLTVREAAFIYSIGENKLRSLANVVPVPNWVLMDGRNIRIKRKQFELMIDAINAI